MKTIEEILDSKFKERGIRKGWIGESKQAVLDAMEEYADEKLCLSDVSDSYSKQDVDKLIKAIYQIMPAGRHGVMLREIAADWFKNPNCKPKYPI